MKIIISSLGYKNIALIIYYLCTLKTNFFYSTEYDLNSKLYILFKFNLKLDFENKYEKNVKMSK